MLRLFGNPWAFLQKSGAYFSPLKVFAIRSTFWGPRDCRNSTFSKFQGFPKSGVYDTFWDLEKGRYTISQRLGTPLALRYCGAWQCPSPRLALWQSTPPTYGLGGQKGPCDIYQGGLVYS